MNYRHSFHAGNFADILKHATLARILAYLSLKDAPFRVIDTHAGAGLYDLKSSEANRTGEAREGIERLRATRLDAAAEAVLAPYREILDALSPEGTTYPGSPAIIQYLLRDNDRASLNELHGETFFHLRQALGKDSRLAVNQLDGYMAWKAQVPPLERRGLVLVDPPFEVTDEFERLMKGAEIMGRKWPTGIGVFWYPVKNLAAVARFEDQLAQGSFTKVLIAELHVAAVEDGGALTACGLAILNPPYTLHDELKALLPPLSKLLARNRTARWRLDWLKGP
jgi:23S rRNA (adenine2030-N6)-methyltransferase